MKKCVFCSTSVFLYDEVDINKDRVANKPWKTLKTLDFVCPWKNTLENPEFTIHP